MFRGTIDVVTTVLFYLVIAAVIGLVVFFLAVLVFGRGEQMAPLDPRTSPAELPDHDIDSEDVRKIRFALALRGYRMSDVDWTLERLGEQIDSLRLENGHLREQLSLPEQADPAAEQRPADPGDPADASEATEESGVTADSELWGPPRQTWPTDQPPPEASRLPPDQVRDRLPGRATAPAVDR